MSAAAYDLVSFDLDGTLVDTAGEIAEAVNLALEDHGLAPDLQALADHVLSGRP